MRTEQLTYLDGWRGLAILLLLVGHFLPVPGINFGAVGVRLFFALSGLLMARLLVAQRVPVGRFLRRRVARIFPAAYVFLLLASVAAVLTGRDFAWSETLAAATFTNNYFPGELGHAAMPFGHFWSLCVEEHSYLLLAGLAVAAGRLRARMLPLVALCLAASIAAGAWYVTHYAGRPLFGMLLHTEVAGFTLFASVALYLLFDGRPPRAPALAWCAVAGGALAAQWWSVPVLVQQYGGGLLFALAVNLLPAATPLVQRALSVRPLRMLGTYSFSIYLWQQPFYLYGDGSALHGAIGVALALGAGALSFHLVEQPARRYLNARWTPEPTAVPQRAAA